MPSITALGRQRWVNLYEFETRLVFRGSSRTAKAVTQRNPVSKEKKISFLGTVAHTFNPSTWEAETVSWRLAWSTY